METSQEHINVLARLNARGIKIAIDDFGMGYSSLRHLQGVPVHRIKVAQDFIRKMGTDPKATAIVKAALCLARELGIATIAEGIETAGQLALLRRWGCREGQGFYFAAPMSAAAIIAFLRGSSLMPWSRPGQKQRGRRPPLDLAHPATSQSPC
jgi:EAL domain-containing protein (putative c-di-GMP-specific phosphodiesterase class I)